MSGLQGGSCPPPVILSERGGAGGSGVEAKDLAFAILHNVSPERVSCPRTAHI